MTYSLTSDDDERYHNARGFLYETNKLMRENSETDLLSYQNALIHEKVGPLVRTSFGVGVLMGVRPDGSSFDRLLTIHGRYDYSLRGLRHFMAIVRVLKAVNERGNIMNSSPVLTRIRGSWMISTDRISEQCCVNFVRDGDGSIVFSFDRVMTLPPGFKDNRPQWLKITQPFVAGGLAGSLATCVIQPVDMIKVRIQIAEAGATRSPLVIARNIIANEGFLSLYKGLDAGIVRQLTYTTTRLGVFRLTSMSLQSPHEKTLPFWKKGVAGLFAGGVGAFVGTPADLSLVRLQADATLPPAERRNYKGVFDAMSQIVKAEGVTGLWKGSLPTVTRAMALNVGMLATFDQGKEYFSHLMGPGWGATLTASACSGFGASVMSLPFDFVKTRIQKMRPDANGVMPYTGTLNCFAKVLREEGPLAFYSGFPTYYTRIAPHAMLVLLLVDAINTSVVKSFA